MQPTTLLVTSILLATWLAGTAAAQTAPRGYAAVKGGVNAESAEDNLQGTSAGWGALASFHLSDRWALEGEFWRPGAIPSGPEDGEHRDTLFSIALRRAFSSGRVRPHVLFGVTVARTEDQFTICAATRPIFGSPVPVPVLVSCAEPDVTERQTDRFSSTSLLGMAGAGVAIDIGRRLQVIGDVRVQPWITSFIVRSAIAVGVVF